MILEQLFGIGLIILSGAVVVIVICYTNTVLATGWDAFHKLIQKEVRNEVQKQVKEYADQIIDQRIAEKLQEIQEINKQKERALETRDTIRDKLGQRIPRDELPPLSPTKVN